jgi:hypothetical protein
MKPFAWISKVWVLALTVGLTAASCTMPKSAVLNKGGVLPPLPQNSQIDTSISKELDAAVKATVQAAYGKLPLHFEANQG